MAGHLGAAVVAGYFFGEDHHDLDGRVFAAIEKELDRIVGGEESIWYNQKKAGISITELFAPFAEEEPAEEEISTIARALSANIGRTRQSGHNVTFASLAIRAFHDHPQYATPSIVAGIRKLIEQFNGGAPGRGYYGKQRGWIAGDRVPLTADNPLPLYSSLQAMADVVIEELIGSASMHRQGFGGLFHVVNHAAGIADLSRFGYKDLAMKGLPAHHHHVRLWRSLPDLEDELGTLIQAERDPRVAEYWNRSSSVQWSGWLTHRIKTLYGFFSLLQFVDDTAQRRKAEQSFLYLMA